MNAESVVAAACVHGTSLSEIRAAVAELAAETLAPDAVQLSWRPPQIPNGQIMGYEVGLEV